MAAPYQQRGPQNRPPHQSGENRSYQQAPPLPKLTFLDNGKIPDNLLTVNVEKCVELVPLRGGRALKSHQLRRFYGEFKRIEQKIRQDKDNFDKYRPLIAMLKAKAAYASNPDSQKIPPEFKDFVNQIVDAAMKDQDHFDAAAMAFEAFVGYCYGKGMKE